MNPQILNPGLVNYNNAHIRDPGMSSNQGAVTGCIGSLTSNDALNRTGLYRVQSGGNGYGMSKNQMLSEHSGVHNGNRANFNSYQSVGINSDTNMNTSSQSGGNGTFGAGGVPFYSYNKPEGNLSVFAGSGYPPISRGLNTQCYPASGAMNGGFFGLFEKKKSATKKRKTSSKKKKTATKKKKTASKKKKTASKKKKTSSKKKKSQKGGFQNISNVPYAHGYSTGAPPALAQGQSALANPVPFKSYNHCVDNYNHVSGQK